MRGRKPKPVKPPPAADYSADRCTVYHLCNAPVFMQSIPHAFGAHYHFAFYATIKAKLPSPVCPACHGRLSRSSIRLPGEQYLHEIAQEFLELALAKQRAEEEEADAET